MKKIMIILIMNYYYKLIKIKKKEYNLKIK